MSTARSVLVVLVLISLGCSGLQLAATPTPTQPPAETATAPTAEALTSDETATSAPATAAPEPTPAVTEDAAPDPTSVPEQRAPTATQPPPQPTSTLTPRPEDVPPVILSFSADPTDIVEREPVTLQWQGQGALEAAVWWYDSHALPAQAPDVTDPNNGTVVIHPDAGPIHLTLRNNVGEAEATIDLTIRCAYAWLEALATNPNAARCPFEPETGAAAYQPFQNGFMLWLGPSNQVLVFFNNGTYRAYADSFAEGDMESDPTIVPPEGLLQPVRGFGLVWRRYPEVRDGLGWATASESGFNTWRQGFSGSGMHYVVYFVRSVGDQILELDTFGARWKVYAP